MSLPNLSRLHLETAPTGATAFEHLIQNNVAKNKDCLKHASNPPSNPNPSVHDNSVNCAIDGYYMFKALPPAPGAPPPPADSYLKRVLPVTLGTGERVILSSMGSRAVAVRTRLWNFWTDNGDWVENVFEPVCDRRRDANGEELGTIEWRQYNEELVSTTDWYYLDPNKQGHIFLQLLDTPTFKDKMGMPTRGAFEGRYLYIALVCSLPKTIGSYLMEIAEAACRALGCDGIALASLSNSAPFYLHKGFQFMDRTTGRPIDVTPWLKTVTVNGRSQIVIDDEKDMTIGERKRRTRSADEADAPKETNGGDGDGKRARTRLVEGGFYTAIERARAWSQRWLGGSYPYDAR